MIDQSVGDIMTPSVRTVTPETTACEVAKLFAEHDIGSAVVASGTGDPVGIVTESDIMRQVAAEADTTSVHAGAFMTTPLVTITSTESIHAAAAMMRDHSIRRLPVVEDGDLVGILTTTDLVHYLPRLRNTILRDRKDHSES